MEHTIENLANGSIDIDTLKEAEIEKLLRFASERYYNTDQIIMSDVLYDALLEMLVELNPKNPYLTTVGAPARVRKIALPFPMFSLHKIKPGERTLTNWLQKYAPPYTISDKLDGTSAMLTWTFPSECNSEWSSAKLSMFSRGNGSVGSDLTRLAAYVLSTAFQTPPKRLQSFSATSTIAVRGEIIISKTDFEAFRRDGAVQARSLSNGVVNSRNIQPQIASKMKFIAYEIVEPRLAKSLQMAFLEDWGIPVVWHTTRQNLEESNLLDLLTERMHHSPFDIDGLVVESEGPHCPPTHQNPQYAFAFKSNFSNAAQTTRVTDILWETSVHGRLVPRIKYEPLLFNGATFAFASGKNARHVVENGIFPGSIVEVSLSGCVIPEITKVLKKAEPQLPETPFDWSASGADIVLKSSDRKNNPTCQIKTIVRFFKILGIDGIREGLVKKFYQSGFTSIQKYLQADEKALALVPGIGSNIARKLVLLIHSGLQNVDPARAMMASNAFGPGIGEKKLHVVLDHFPHILTEKPRQDLARLISKLPGFDMITANKIVQGLEECKTFLKSNPQIIIENSFREPIQGKHLLNNLNYVFTGFRDKNLSEKIQRLGGTVTNTVSSRTTAVIFKTECEGAKLDKAKAMHIPTIQLDLFLENLP